MRHYEQKKSIFKQCFVCPYDADDHSLILWSGAALFSASDIVLREEWRHFIQHLKIKKQLQGIQGLGFTLLIPRDELALHLLEPLGITVETDSSVEDALHRGDIQQLRGLVETLERDHAEVASGIRILVDAYDYDRLRHLIEASPPPGVL